MAPRVSVVCASYNHAKYVRAAIESVLAQSFGDFELVMTDDGSSDATVQTIRAIEDPRIRLEALPRNFGACIALNHALSRAGGEYVAILNSDDLFLPGKLERQVAFLDANPAIAAVFGHASFIGEDGAPYAGDARHTGLVRLENRDRHAWLRHLFLHGNVFCHPSVLIRRRLYGELGPYNPAMAQLPDYELWVRLLLRHEVHVMPDALVAFRVRDQLANASAPRPEVVARDAWEQRRVLEQYLALSTEEFERVFPDRADRLRGMPVAFRLGELALTLPRPAAILFGLDAMYGALPAIKDPGVIREFIRLTGAFDPYAATIVPGDQRRLALPPR